MRNFDVMWILQTTQSSAVLFNNEDISIELLNTTGRRYVYFTLRMRALSSFYHFFNLFVTLEAELLVLMKKYQIPWKKHKFHSST